MPEAESQTGPRFCRQCGAVVPEGTAVCPRCGKRWYMDRVEQQGVELWQRILEKRASAGQDDTDIKDQKEYRCPNCMAVLKEPVAVCPHCGKSTTKAKIVPQGARSDEFEVSQGSGQDKPTASEAARGAASIKGASARAAAFRPRKKLKRLDILIICAIVVIVGVMAFLIARQYGFSISLPAAAPAKPAQTATSTPPATPVISGVTVSNVTADGATIAWNTDIPSYGRLAYGTTDSYGATSAVDNISSSHRVALGGLQAGSTYHFAVQATDANGGELASGADTMFNTVAAHVVVPPIVSQYNVVPTDISAIVSWTTDKPATSQVLYGPDKSTSNASPVDTKLVTSHTLRIGGLKAGTTYYYRIKSVDADGAAATMDPADLFTTLVTVPVGSAIGDRAPDFTLNIFNTQNSISLRDLKGQKVVLAFWAVFCPECDRELAQLQSLQNKNMAGVKIVAVFVDSKPEDIDGVIAQYKSQNNNADLTLPVCVDPYKTTAHAYNVEKVPCTYFIDGDMIVRNVVSGSFNSDQIEAILNGL